MAHLYLLAFGGNTHTGGSSTDPVVEIWECTLAFSAAGDGYDDQGTCDIMAAALTEWFSLDDTHISETEELAYVKWNEYSLVTGRQVTDPTIQTLVSQRGGSGANSLPVSMTYRISIDDGTRNPRHRGGFFPPRTGYGVQDDGRCSPAHVAGMLSSAKSLIDALNAVSTPKVGIWSRADKEVHTATRIRVGDVPDNISTRRNHLRETYQSDSI